MADHYKRYSLLDFGESMLPDASPRAARYERGLSEMVTEACPDIRSRMGSPLPTRKMALQVQRDLGSDGVATAGGNLMPVGILATVEAARPPLVFEHLGARILTITSEKNTSLPTLTVEVSGGWVNEFAPAPSFSQLTIKSAALSAKQASARVGYSRRLRASSPDGAAFEASGLREVSRAVRQVLENGLINGTGYSGEPQGIVNTTGRQTKSFAGSVPTLSELVDMFELLGRPMPTSAPAHGCCTLRWWRACWRRSTAPTPTRSCGSPDHGSGCWDCRFRCRRRPERRCCPGGLVEGDRLQFRS